MDTIDQTIAAAIRRAIASHAKPLPDYVQDSPVHARFRLGNAADGWHKSGDSLTRSGRYVTYARRATHIPLVAGYAASPTHWNPGVYFLPADVSLLPEPAYNGSPLERGLRIVPVDTQLSRKAIQRRVFGYVLPALEALAAFYERTGERFEVLRLRELDRCLATGEPFEMTEYPADRSTLS